MGQGQEEGIHEEAQEAEDEGATRRRNVKDVENTVLRLGRRRWNWPFGKSSGDGRPPTSFSIVFHQSRNTPPLSFSPLAMYDYGITFLKIFPKADYKKISSSFS